MTYERTIYLKDTDAAGVVYFASLMSICHEAYEVSLEAAGVSLRAFLDNPEMAIPLVHAEIDFFRPLFCGDRIQIILAPQILDDNSFEVTYQINKLSNGNEAQIVAKAQTRHVSINPNLRRKIVLPQEIIDWLESFS